MATIAATQTSRSFLEALTGPGDLRRLPAGQLPALAAGIRDLLVEKVSATGGHLGPNLGVVELTLALHRVFDVEHGDVVLFDTGHQGYVHKPLTGRQAAFDRLRQAGGLSGYLCRAEPAHDWSENSHASTALSYADGLVKARHLAGGEGCVVAVVGDEALTGGMTWEALNNLGADERPVIVLLNDNGRSYAPTVGALAVHLAALRDGPKAARCRNVFTEWGFAYLGPVDGHDISAVKDALRRARVLERPVVVHAVTVKGKGHPPAENDQADHLHAVGPATPGVLPGQEGGGPSWTAVFSQALLDLGGRRADLLVLTAAMGGPTGLAPFAAGFPDRFFDVGIAEQHAVNLRRRAGDGRAAPSGRPLHHLSGPGLRPSPDGCCPASVAGHLRPGPRRRHRPRRPVPPRHVGYGSPGDRARVRLAVRRDANQLQALLGEATAHCGGPSALRFPKATAGLDITAVRQENSVDVLAALGFREVLLIAYGPLAAACLTAATTLRAQGIGVTVADPRWALPVAPDLIALAARHRLVVTVEDGVRTTGIGTQVTQACRDAGLTTPVHNLGLPRTFLARCPRDQILAQAALVAPGITHAVLRARCGRLHHAHPADGSP